MALTSPARGQAPSSGPAVLWYRSSEGCPDWAAFLTRLGDRGSLVRSAEVGDRVDFVINIAVTPEGARGRLERETEGGTVAIREVEDARCERVADVVALNLALALDPERPAPRPAANPAAPPPEGTSAMTNSDTAGSASELKNAPTHSPPRPELRPASRAAQHDIGGVPAEQSEAPLTSARWRVGLQGGALGAINPAVHARGTVFVERDAGFALLPYLSVRAALVAAFGSTATESGTVRQSIWAGRLELCPLRFGDAVLSLRACGAGEAGQFRARRAYDDASLWWALGGHLRGGWLLTRAVALEAEAGILVPLQRYEVSAGASILYRSAAIGLAASAGASIAF